MKFTPFEWSVLGSFDMLIGNTAEGEWFARGWWALGILAFFCAYKVGRNGQ